MKKATLFLLLALIGLTSMCQTVFVIRQDTTKIIAKGNMTRFYHEADTFNFDTWSDYFKFTKHTKFDQEIHVLDTGRFFNPVYIQGIKLDSISLGSETVNRDIYIETTGSDISGDGSELNPYLSLTKAISSIKNTIDGAYITLKIGTGTFNGDTLINELYKKSYVNNGSIEIQGDSSAVVTGITLSNSVPVDKFEYVSSESFTLNQYQDHFATSDASAFFPISYTNGTEAEIAQVDVTSFNAIYKMNNTVLTITNSLEQFKFLEGQGVIKFRYCKFEITGGHLRVVNTGGVLTDYEVCIFDLMSNNKKLFFYSPFDEDIFRRNIVLVTGNVALIMDETVSDARFYNVYLRNKLANNTSTGIKIAGTRFGHVIIDNFYTGVTVNEGYSLTLYNDIKVCNSGAAISHDNSNTTIINQLNPIVIENTNFVLRNNLTNGKNVHISPSILGSPNTSYFVPLAGGAWGTTTLTAPGQVNNSFINLTDNRIIKELDTVPDNVRPLSVLPTSPLEGDRIRLENHATFENGYYTYINSSWMCMSCATTGINYGTDGQIAYMNATNDGFIYDADCQYKEDTLKAPNLLSTNGVDSIIVTKDEITGVKNTAGTSWKIKTNQGDTEILTLSIYRDRARTNWAGSLIMDESSLSLRRTNTIFSLNDNVISAITYGVSNNLKFSIDTGMFAITNETDSLIYEGGLLKYNLDKSGILTDYSLTPKNYVDQQITSSSPNLQTVLSNGSTGTITSGKFGVIYEDASYYNYLDVRSSQGVMLSGRSKSSNAAAYGEFNASRMATQWTDDYTSGDFKSIIFNATGMVVTDAIDLKGLENAADYSANATDRSLIDLAHINSLISTAGSNYAGLALDNNFTGENSFIDTTEVAEVKFVNGAYNDVMWLDASGNFSLTDGGGASLMWINRGNYSISMGQYAGRSSSSTNSFGRYAGFLCTGANNVYNGYRAAAAFVNCSNNVVIGGLSARTMPTSSGMTIVGANSLELQATGLNGCTFLGNGLYQAGSAPDSALVIGNDVSVILEGRMKEGAPDSLAVKGQLTVDETIFEVKKIYASAFLPSSLSAVTSTSTSDTYNFVKGSFVNTISRGVSFDVDTLQIDRIGVDSVLIEIHHTASITSDGSYDITVGFSDNGTAFACTEKSASFGTSETKSISHHCTLWVSDGDDLKYVVKSSASNSDITFSNVDLIIEEKYTSQNWDQ